MEIISGHTAAGGIAIGSLRVCRRKGVRLRGASECSPTWELARFDRARGTAQKQLSDLYRYAMEDVGEDIASIFEVHQVLLEDDDYVHAVQDFLDKGDTAQYAAASAGALFASMFDGLEDGYMKARASDMRDITNRMLRILSGAPEAKQLASGPAILAIDDLTPSEAVELGQEHLLGVVLRFGSCLSHTSILARALGIPALVETLFDEDWDGKHAALDCNEGYMYVDPTAELLAGLEERRREAL